MNQSNKSNRNFARWVLKEMAGLVGLEPTTKKLLFRPKFARNLRVLLKFLVASC